MSDADKVDILIVDDLQEKLLVLESILGTVDARIITARSGEEALRRVLERDFAVILLDVNMPGMDGFETAGLIRTRKKSAHTPIIFLTAFADEMHAHRGYSLGAVDYILTPVVPDVLRTKVKVFVDLFRMARQIKRQADERIALAQEQAARAAAEEATRRSTFLAEASKILAAASLDAAATLRGLLRILVPALGDLGVLTLLDHTGGQRPAELTWIDSTGAQHTEALTDAGRLHPDLKAAIAQVLDAGESRLLPKLATGSAVIAENTQQIDLPAFELTAAVVLPLVGRGKMLGALAAGVGPSGRVYGPADLALAEDLTGRAAIALDNARLYRDIQKSDRAKNEFLAMLAHELRNPLAPIRNACQILRVVAPDQPELTTARDMIDRQVQHLVRLVDDLLDISRITRGKIQLRPEPVEVAAVVARAVEVSRPLIEARKHQLTVREPSERLWVRADPLRLAQVLANLLNNAAKYTEEGGRIWLSAQRDGRHVAFRVRDTGIGIPAEMLPNIFDLFTQVDRSIDRSEGGLGIGLTLVKRLVEMHGGSVRAYSAGPGKGSEFLVRLPALAEPPSDAATEYDDKQSTGLASRRVLLVDDNVDAAESLATLLRLQGHDVRLAHDGVTALKTAESFQPEVVLLDIGLPGMDGYEVAERLRREVKLSDALLAALTGYGRDDDRRRSRAAGIDIHLVKPVDLAALQAMLARPLELRTELHGCEPNLATSH
jgi:signal transduction histidine kinase/DNA-binding response OmpR family regulator